MNVGNESVLEKARVWQKKKNDAGWAMRCFQKNLVVLEATPIERIIWSEEESKFDVPRGNL